MTDATEAKQSSDSGNNVDDAGDAGDDQQQSGQQRDKHPGATIGDDHSDDDGRGGYFRYCYGCEVAPLVY